MVIDLDPLQLPNPGLKSETWATHSYVAPGTVRGEVPLEANSPLEN